MEFTGGARRAVRKPGYCLLLSTLIASSAFPQTINEYRVKAAFLYNFAGFVEWPAAAFSSDKEPIRICVLGKDPFGRALEEAVHDRTVSGRSFLVADIADTSHTADCRILFIGSSEKNRMRSIFRSLPATGILTVGDTEGFATQGGIVNFKLEGGKVRFEINVEAAERENLRISSKVLTLAEIVKPEIQK